MPNIVRTLLVALALVGFSAGASGQDSSFVKTAGGLTAYLGIVPAEILRGHAPSHAEARAHGGPPSGAHAYHVMVAVFDATTGARIPDAKVAARVSSLGLVGPRKTLETMKIADTVTYGNYFDLPGKGQYRINVEVERPQGHVRFEFTYEH